MLAFTAFAGQKGCMYAEQGFSNKDAIVEVSR